jgi:hypothetical protein
VKAQQENQSEGKKQCKNKNKKRINEQRYDNGVEKRGG